MASLLVIHTTKSGAQASNDIESIFAASPAPLPTALEAGPLTLSRVACFGTAGKQVESYPKAPAALKPFAIAEPATPTRKVGGAGQHAFISVGRPVRLVGKN